MKDKPKTKASAAAAANAAARRKTNVVELSVDNEMRARGVLKVSGTRLFPSFPSQIGWQSWRKPQKLPESSCYAGPEASRLDP